MTAEYDGIPNADAHVPQFGCEDRRRRIVANAEREKRERERHTERDQLRELDTGKEFS